MELGIGVLGQCRWREHLLNRNLVQTPLSPTAGSISVRRASQPGPTRGLRSSPEPDLSLQVLSADHLPLLPHIPVSLCILSFSKDSPPRVHSSPCSRHLGTTQHLASLPSSKHPSPTVILASLQLPGPLETHQVLGQEPALVQPTAGA